MARRVFQCILGAILLAGVLAGAGAWYLTRPIAHPEAVVTIEPGTSVVRIAAQLGAAGVVSHPQLFRWFVRLRGAGKSLKAGEYVFADGLSLLDVSRKLERGAFRVFRVSFPEGWTMRQMAEHLATQPFATPGFAETFLAACRDPALIARLGIADAATLEGYLFPETYDLHRPKDAGAVVARLVAEFQKRLTPTMVERAQALGLTVHQVVTLASIIEKETGAAAERPVVSAVFHNRLKKGMPLASDPTVIYGLPQYDGNIHKHDLSNPHPYNTYIHPELPPGPIANPGLAALEAALHPAPTDYLFFVSRNDGTHAFAVTYADHLRNVAKYQLHR